DLLLAGAVAHLSVPATAGRVYCPWIRRPAWGRAGEGNVTTRATQLPYQGTMAGFRRFSVTEYPRLIELGILTEDDNLELLEGFLVHKMSRNPPHDACLHRPLRALLCVLPPCWRFRIQSAITRIYSEPEPALSAVGCEERRYAA